MMLVNLKDVKTLIDFFEDHVQGSNKGVKVLLGKIEYYNDEEKILEEEPDHHDTMTGVYGGSGNNGGCSCPCKCGSRNNCKSEDSDDSGGGALDEDEQNENAAAEKVKYFLFSKPPTVKDVKQKAEDLLQKVSEKDQQVRKHLLALLMEAETLHGLKITVMDQNSLSEIMSVIRQHIEKKKAFGA